MPVTRSEVVEWGAQQWKAIRRENQTEQKWRDLVACCRSLLDNSVNPQKCAEPSAPPSAGLEPSSPDQTTGEKQ